MAVCLFYNYYIVIPSAIIRRGGNDCRGFVVRSVVVVLVAVVVAVAVIMAYSGWTEVAACG